MTSSNSSGEPRLPTRGKLLPWMVVATVGLTCCCLLLPSVQKVRDGEGRVYSAVIMKRIGLALHDYHATHHKLPPAVVRDKEVQLACAAALSGRDEALPAVQTDLLGRREKVSSDIGSFRNSMDLGGLARQIQKRAMQGHQEAADGGTPP